MTTTQLNICFEGYLREMDLDDFLEFLSENNISYSRIPRHPMDEESYLVIVPNHPELTKRYFKRDHSQFEK